MSLGPYALCLSFILANARSDFNQFVKYVYRGMRIPRTIFIEQFGHDDDQEINYSESLLRSTNYILG